MKKFNHKCVRYDRLDLRKFLKVSFVLLIFVIASVPLSTFVNAKDKDKDKDKDKPPKDKSAEFTVFYDTYDPDFGTIDYSGIEYYLDGVLLTTDISGIIDLKINNFDVHNLTIIFGGIRHEFIFNESIIEDIVLATKSIDAIVYWDEIDMPATGMYVSTFDLLYYDGTNWIFIETATTDEFGRITFNSLIMGSYMLVKTGEIDGIEFIIDQLTDTYTTDILVIPDKTIIDIDYLNTIQHGTDYPVDLNDITWTIEASSNGGASWATITDYYYVSLDLSDIANGKIVIYELIESASSYTYIYRIYIGDGWDIGYSVIRAMDNQIDIPAKSLEAEFLWSYDSTPVELMDFELFWFDGINYISIGIYTTDVNGMITITELLLMGQYKFDDYTEFTITAMDDIKIVNYIVESLLGGIRTPAWILFGSVKSKLFSFFTIKIKLDLFMLTLNHRAVGVSDGFCLKISPSTLFLYISQRLNLSFMR